MDNQPISELNVEAILEKLEKLKDDCDTKWVDWDAKEKLNLLKMYYIICKKEHMIFDLIYTTHWCDSWEDIFRDYSRRDLKDKVKGVQVAIEIMMENDSSDDNSTK